MHVRTPVPSSGAGCLSDVEVSGQGHSDQGHPEELELEVRQKEGGEDRCYQRAQGRSTETNRQPLSLPDTQA